MNDLTPHLKRKIRVTIPLNNGTPKQTVKLSGITNGVKSYRCVGYICHPGIVRLAASPQTFAVNVDSGFETGTQIVDFVATPQFTSVSETECFDICTQTLERLWLQRVELTPLLTSNKSIFQTSFERATGQTHIRTVSSNDTYPFGLSGTTNMIDPNHFLAVLGLPMNVDTSPLARTHYMKTPSLEPFPYSFSIFAPSIQTRTISGGLVQTTSDLSLNGGTYTHPTPLLVVRRDPYKPNSVVFPRDIPFIQLAQNFQPERGIEFEIVPYTQFPSRQFNSTFPNPSGDMASVLFHYPSIDLFFEFIV